MPKKNGRPIKYEGEVTDKRVFNLALLGLTDAQIAKCLSVSYSLLNRWKTDHPSFMDAIRTSKDEADAKVFACLRSRATGYSYTSKKDVIVNDKKVTLEEEKHYPPDVPAIKSWLANRRKMKFNYDNVSAEEAFSLTPEQLNEMSIEDIEILQKAQEIIKNNS